jgi:DNA primase
MPLIPEDLIEQVRDAADIVEIVSDHVTLTKRGKNYLGLCPFHEDRRPSLNVSQDKQIYKCFACGAGGNVFTFLMEMERVSFVEAVRKLADRAGMTLPETETPSDSPEAERVLDGLYKANELARNYYHHLLVKDSAGAEASSYLNDRGISPAAVENFRLGYAPKGWHSLIEVAERRGVDVQTLHRAGLVLPRNDGKGFYDRFRNRIIFPILSHTGRTVAFGARALDPDETSKYLNSPETPVYRKSHVLYGLWQARDTIRDQGEAVVVEGYTDLIAMVEAGIRNVVASSGTALTQAHARLLGRYAKRAVLVFDGDAAGRAAAERGIEALLDAGLDIRVASLPEGQDPDGTVRERGGKAMEAFIQGADSALDYLFTRLAAKEDLSTLDGKTRATHAMAGWIALVKDEARRRFLVQASAERIRIDEATMLNLVRAQGRRSRTGRRVADARPETFDPRPRSERELVMWMMFDDQKADAVLDQIEPDDFSNGVYKRIASLVARSRQDNLSISPALLVDACEEDPQLVQIISSIALEVEMVDPERVALPLEDYIHSIKLKELNAKIQATQAELRSADADIDLTELLRRHIALTRARKNLLDATRSSEEVGASP